MLTLVDCGCQTKVYGDGSGVEVYFCPLHDAAPELLEACKQIENALVSIGAADHPDLRTDIASLRDAIQKAEAP